MKKVLLLIIDALSSRVVLPALQENRLPNFRKIYDAADYRGESIAIFPSITPAATTSLITGRYPKDHGISGAYWYLKDKHEVVYFGYDIWAVIDMGIDTFIDEFLIKLNEEHLHAPTIFHLAETQGLTTASLNYLIFHGDNPHKLEMPGRLNWLRDAVAGLITDDGEDAIVNGPQLHYFGDIIHTKLPSGHELDAPGGPNNRFGFSDDSTAALLEELVARDSLYDFTVAYFPDNDFQSHSVGPESAIDTVIELDEKIGRIIEQFGGLDRMLEEVCLVVTGDHSQSNVVDEKNDPGIKLDELLGSFSIASPGEPMEDSDNLVICPNLRSAQIYFHSPTQNRLRRVTESLLSDQRIDQVIWSGDVVDSEPAGIHILTADRGKLNLKRGIEPGMASAQDVYGNEWSWEGDLETVDGRVEEGIVTFGDYPNAFERLAGVLDLPIAGHLWATSRPGYEFCLETTRIHSGGGSHGSLHALDSLSPLWVAGAEKELSVPAHPRSVDVAPICLHQLGVDF